MYPFQGNKKVRGFTLIEVIVVIGITGLIFGGLFASFEYSLKLIAHSRSKMTGLSLATDRMEYIRSLPYNSVGTVAGIPNGAIPQNRIVSLNGIEFSERVLIEYIDDPADGVGGSDSNSIVADYKKLKVEYSWTSYGVPSSFSLISSIVPRSIETTAGGGTLRVNVFDAEVVPLPGIDVRLLNTTGTTTVDVTRMTDSTGTAFFTGAPAAAGYEIFVSAPGYSSDQTRVATTSLPNPMTLPVAVLESDVSTMNFQVDLLSDLIINVFNNVVTDSEVEPFDDYSGMATTSDVNISGGELKLSGSAGSYVSTGSAIFNPITPATILHWGIIEVGGDFPAVTSHTVRFYTSTDTASIILDSDLPGNGAGFTDSFIDLTELDPVTFPTIVVGIEIGTSDANFTPEVDMVSVSYVESKDMLAAAPLTLRGNKVIGTDASAALVYKYSISTTTNSSGELALDDIEWDSYIVTVGGGQVVEEACSANPIFLSPNTTVTLDLSTGASSAHNLRVAVKAGDSSPVIGADVELTLGGSTWNGRTGRCGQAFFGGLSEASDYRIEVSRDGYTTQSVSSTTVSGVTVQDITLLP